MQALSAANLLEVWERGLTQSPAQRGLLLLTHACPEMQVEQLAQLPIGQRDALLLTIREGTFGSQMGCVTRCPDCSNRLELALNTADIRVETLEPVDEPQDLKVASYSGQFRLPNSLDLVLMPSHLDLESAQRWLLERCLLEITQEGQSQTLDQLPPEVATAISDRMAEADPQAEIQLDLTCPNCGHQWPLLFDIVSFFWEEIQVWGQRLLYQVHRLAAAYGWREADILAMSAQRRQQYMELLGS